MLHSENWANEDAIYATATESRTQETTEVANRCGQSILINPLK